MIARIFYSVNRSWSGRISVSELRRSSFLTTLRLLQDEDDINQVTDFFSYEHFYVIYCKFWELDKGNMLQQIIWGENINIQKAFTQKFSSVTEARNTDMSNIYKYLLGQKKSCFYLKFKKKRNHPHLHHVLECFGCCKNYL